MAHAIRLYFDESVEVAVCEQLREKGIDAINARDLDALGDSDIDHLQRATAMGRVFCTYDTDFLILAAQGTNHAGIVFGQSSKHSIGDWVKALVLIFQILTADEMQNHIEYL